MTTFAYRHFVLVTMLALAPMHANGVEVIESQKNLLAFPPPSDGKKRYVIHLPPLPNEEEAKIEIVAGRYMEVDCNIHFFGGHLNPGIVKGWGFNIPR